MMNAVLSSFVQTYVQRCLFIFKINSQKKKKINPKNNRQRFSYSYGTLSNFIKLYPTPSNSNFITIKAYMYLHATKCTVEGKLSFNFV